MPKRLLFVDDESMLLDGLRRVLRGMRGDWDMHFLTSAHAALEALQQENYDAIITDMRMPEMDGAKLLDLVKERHPSVIRMVLSGQASRAAVLCSIAPAHQFLSKPCDPQELVARLAQAFAMRDLLANQSLKTIVSRLKSIPSLPAIYDELTAALRCEDPSLAQIERIISRDPGMAAKILQLANSAFIGASGRVSNLLQAVSLIGTETVRTLVLSIHVFSQFDSNSAVAGCLPSLWDHSVDTASLAQQIATSENSPKAIVEESFTGGLLHDIGKVVLLAEMPRDYLPILQTNPDALTKLELERLGCTHAQVGGYLMSVWGLPVPLVRAVVFHHSPAESAEMKFSSVTAVHAADAIAGTGNSSPLNRDADLDLLYLDRLGIAARLDVWRNFHRARMATVPAGPELG
jgi:HD-like signal output (HDOD) protein/CheY-like chemotaxis protein